MTKDLSLQEVNSWLDCLNYLFRNGLDLDSCYQLLMKLYLQEQELIELMEVVQ